MSENRLIDLPHFDAENHLSSCLNMDVSEDGGLFVTITGNPREASRGKSRITTKLNQKEVAYVFTRLMKHLMKG